jgi:hypothetical protein
VMFPTLLNKPDPSTVLHSHQIKGSIVNQSRND